ncbi:4'-phosphopantetheinyl transferase family protein [Chitinophaga sp. RAB17]|uniref:4'-phosphopantetheinyl transferase family protein n=1 Tax=Chitinophaga sp. RAB17 TaxID=3233049 RepID=UPI003F9141C2
MITYSFFLYTQQLNPHLYDTLLQCVPEQMRPVIGAYHRWEDRQNHLFGKLLLRDLLCQEGYDPDSLERIYANPYGKLFLDDSIDFNISHSGNLVMVAVSRCGRVGVDVEKKGCLQPEDIAAALRPDELKQLKNKPANEALYQLWIKKESLVKAKGAGLSIDLNTIHLYADRGILNTGNGLETWYYQSLPVHAEYVAILCTESQRPLLQYAPAEDMIDRAIRYAGINMPEIHLFG